ncbi:hypothetical protein JXI42_02980 [bacterium]|nr:hypothetical protein [bacterium]
MLTKTWIRKTIVILILSCTITASVYSDESFRAVAELGFLGVLDHKVQFSKSGTYFDYVKDGGQDVLFFTNRLSLEWDWSERNTLILLYQPIAIETRQMLEKDLVVDDLVYPAGTPVKFFYGFPFYRLSYLREMLPENQEYDLALGLSFQIRNATINFESLDGKLLRTQRDIGPVPALKVRTRWHFSEKAWLGFEADGIYAPISYLNGSDEEITGAILDASLRMGMEIKEPAKVFLNVRYLGGGAVGTNEDEEGPGDGYVKNWLHFLTVTTGFIIEL